MVRGRDLLTIRKTVTSLCDSTLSQPQHLLAPLFHGKVWWLALRAGESQPAILQGGPREHLSGLRETEAAPKLQRFPYKINQASSAIHKLDSEHH